MLEGKAVLYVKGAPEILLSLCNLLRRYVLATKPNYSSISHALCERSLLATT